MSKRRREEPKQQQKSKHVTELPELPRELWYEILRWLEPDDMETTCRLTLVNKQLSGLSDGLLADQVSSLVAACYDTRNGRLLWYKAPGPLEVLCEAVCCTLQRYRKGQSNTEYYFLYGQLMVRQMRRFFRAVLAKPKQGFFDTVAWQARRQLVLTLLCAKEVADILQYTNIHRGRVLSPLVEPGTSIQLVYRYDTTTRQVDPLTLCDTLRHLSLPDEPCKKKQQPLALIKAAEAHLAAKITPGRHDVAYRLALKCNKHLDERVVLAYNVLRKDLDHPRLSHADPTHATMAYLVSKGIPGAEEEEEKKKKHHIFAPELSEFRKSLFFYDGPAKNSELAGCVLFRYMPALLGCLDAIAKQDNCSERSYISKIDRAGDDRPHLKGCLCFSCW
jgi:hypothetical protein